MPAKSRKPSIPQIAELLFSSLVPWVWLRDTYILFLLRRKNILHLQPIVFCKLLHSGFLPLPKSWTWRQNLVLLFASLCLFETEMDCESCLLRWKRNHLGHRLPSIRFRHFQFFDIPKHKNYFLLWGKFLGIAQYQFFQLFVGERYFNIIIWRNICWIRERRFFIQRWMA